MKNKLFIIFIICSQFIYAIDKNIENSDLTVIEITDTNLDNISYHNTSFETPTKLVFKNLTTVNGDISFHQTANLVEIEFPLLESTQGFLYFHQNNNLESIEVPLLKSLTSYLYFYENTALKNINLSILETVYSYVSITGNTALENLQICNLIEILPVDDFDTPYYSISNNTSIVDNNQPCWGSIPPTDLTLSNNSVKENQIIGSVVGDLSGMPSNENLTYYFDDNDIMNPVTGELYSNEFFKIEENQLQTNASIDYEAQNQFLIKIYVRNSYGEKFGKEFTVHIKNDRHEDVTIIEITDTTLDNIYYDTNFETPTKLVFKNLTTVNGDISFHQTANLVAIEFPLLESTQGFLYFHKNNSLEDVEAPLLKSLTSYLYFHENISLININLNNLETVYNYVYLQGNTSLEDLQICNLIEILPLDEFDEPYYSISNNTSEVDNNQPCWESEAPTDLTLSNNFVNENEGVNFVVGDLTGIPSNQNLTYYLDMNNTMNDEGEEYQNEFFKIENNQLLTNVSFDFEAQNEYLIKIFVRNSYGEKLGKEFTVSINDIENEEITVIEVTDATLDNVYYYNSSFTGPTKLIFTNLTEVNGNIFFYNTINLTEIEFPKLTNVNGHVYIDNNHSLNIVDFPMISSINDYMYVSRNNLLTDLNICSLSEIIQAQSNIDPYYYIKNNPLLNYDTTCLANTVITINYFNEVSRDETGNYLVATFSSDAGSEFTIEYFFIDDNGNETTNNDFEIVGNKLYLTKEFNYYQGNQFSIKIGAIRFENSSFAKSNSSATSNNVGLNEKIEEIFGLDMSNSVLNVASFISEEDFNIYPNPTLDVLFIKNLDKQQIKEIKIIDFLGKELKKIKHVTNDINLRDFKSGVYYLLIKTEEKIVRKKIIKN